jgi:hypothetical protein
VAPERVVLLSARDGDAEGGPHHVRLEPCALAKQPPPALLVDERLPDVEEHGRQQQITHKCPALDTCRVCAKASTDKVP